MEVTKVNTVSNEKGQVGGYDTAEVSASSAFPGDSIGSVGPSEHTGYSNAAFDASRTGNKQFPTAPPAYDSIVRPAYQNSAPPGFQSTAPPGFQSTVSPGFQSTAPPGSQSIVLIGQPPQHVGGRHPAHPGPPVVVQPGAVMISTQGPSVTREPYQDVPNYLWLAILSLLFCLCFGIASIVLAFKANNLKYEFKYQQARSKANAARNVAIIGIVIGVILTVLTIVL